MNELDSVAMEVARIGRRLLHRLRKAEWTSALVNLMRYMVTGSA